MSNQDDIMAFLDAKFAGKPSKQKKEKEKVK